MGFLDRLRSRRNAEDDEGQRKSYASKKVGKGYDFFATRNEQKTLDEYRKWYDNGGLVAQAIDTHPLDCLTNGYRLEGEDENLIKIVQDRLDAMDTYGLMFQAIRDAVLVRHGVLEVIKTRGNDFLRLVPCMSETFTQNTDEKGNVVGYTQEIYAASGEKRIVQFAPDGIVWFDAGLWLMDRAKDDIIRDTHIIESIAKSIERHGFPRYHIKVGAEGEEVDQTTMDAIAKEFEELKVEQEFMTVRGVDIVNIDNAGVMNVRLYNDVSIERLAMAFGVPEEMLGLGRGSTEATATVRKQAFFDRIASLQQRFARVWNIQVIDRITKKPGSVKMVFNDISVEDEMMKMNYIKALASINPADPQALASFEWMRDYLGITGEDDDEDLTKDKPEQQKQVDANAESSQGTIPSS